VAFLVLLVVGIVVAQTWLDWRDANAGWVIPEWAKGMALAGVCAVSLASATAFASDWMQTRNLSAASAGSHSRFLWPEVIFLVCALAIIIFGLRRKRLPLMVGLTAVLVAAFWIGMSMSS